MSQGESIEEAGPLREDDDLDDEIEEQEKNKKKKKKKKGSENKEGYERRLKGAKNLILSPFRKFEKAYTRRKRRPPPPPFPYSEELGKGCYFCFAQPRVALDSPLRPKSGEKASSLNDFLRSLIEKNDFYSPECNVHVEK